MILIHSCAITGMMLNLILFAIHAEVVMDDLIDSIVKVRIIITIVVLIFSLYNLLIVPNCTVP